MVVGYDSSRIKDWDYSEWNPNFNYSKQFENEKIKYNKSTNFFQHFSDSENFFLVFLNIF